MKITNLCSFESCKKHTGSTRVTKCPDHIRLKCSECGSEAYIECHTKWAGAMMCGYPLCNTCTHTCEKEDTDEYTGN